MIKSIFKKRLLIFGILITILINIFFLILIVKPSVNIRPVDINKDYKKITSACTDEFKLDYCLSGVFYDYAKNHKIEDSIALLGLVRSKSNYLNCHLIAHKISGVEVAKNPSKWMDIFDKADLNDCSRGFFHGAIEGYTNSNGSFKLTSSTLTSLCQNVSNKIIYKSKYEASNSSCIHAAAHMLLVQERGDISRAMAICKKLNTGLIAECSRGIIMEKMSGENLSIHEIEEPMVWNKENVLLIESLCKSFSTQKEISKGCWLSLADMYAAVMANDSYNNIIKLCSVAPLDSGRDYCEYEGIGMVAYLKIYNNQNLDTTKNACDYYIEDNDRFKKCLDVLMPFLKNSGEYKTLSNNLCSNILKTEVKDYCYLII